MSEFLWDSVPPGQRIPVRQYWKLKGSDLQARLIFFIGFDGAIDIRASANQVFIIVKWDSMQPIIYVLRMRRLMD